MQINNVRPLAIEIPKNPGHVHSIRDFNAPQQRTAGAIDPSVRIELSEVGMLRIDIHRAFDSELRQIAESGESTGDRLHDLAVAFDRIQHRFNPAHDGRPPSSSTNAAERFVSGEVFTRGEIIFYNDSYWEILQDFVHNGDQNWRPGLAHSLFGNASPPQTPREFCPHLHDIFTERARMSLSLDAIIEAGTNMGFDMSENGLRMVNEQGSLRPWGHWSDATRSEWQAAWVQGQRQGNIFGREFLNNVYTQGYQAAFDVAAALIR